MLTALVNRSFKPSLHFKCLTAPLFLLLCAVANGQTTNISEQQTAATPAVKKEEVKPAPMPLVKDYKGVAIGMTEDEVRDKLGKPELSDPTGFFYVFSDDERAQIGFDKDKKVNMIAVFYSAENENAPKYADVFGQDAAGAAKPDGSIQNLVNYPQAGYWVAYSRLAGDKAMVTVTMQKIQSAPK